MNKGYVTLCVIVALVVGIFAGAIVFPNQVIEEAEECPAVVACEVCPEIANETLTCPVEESILDKAVADFLDAVDDEEDEAGNDVDALNGYDFDEISVSKIYDEYTVLTDGDETTVTFKIRLKYKETDEASEKEIYDVEVRYEDDEDTEVEIL